MEKNSESPCKEKLQVPNAKVDGLKMLHISIAHFIVLRKNLSVEINMEMYFVDFYSFLTFIRLISGNRQMENSGFKVNIDASIGG